MQIITNWQFRPLLCLQDLPESAREEFDYVDDDYAPRFINYRGAWIDCVDTQAIEPDNGRARPMGYAMRVHPGSPLCHFDSIISDSFFSGLVFRFSRDGDSVMPGRYFS